MSRTVDPMSAPPRRQAEARRRESARRNLRPRQDSNLRTRLRRAVLYPLSYGGSRRLARLSGLQRPSSPYAGRMERGYDARRRRPVSRLRPPRVLVCDDTDAVRHLIRVNLELEGYDVIEAHDGEEALNIL